MRRRHRGPGTTLAASVGGGDGCQVCGRAIEAGEPVAWTWSRQRIHEACRPIWLLASRGRRPLGPWIAEAVRIALERHGGRSCTACLAMALSLSLPDAKEVVAIVAEVPGFRILPVMCATCGRSLDALCIVPTAVPSTVTPPGAKCAQCSRLLADTQTMTIGEDVIHRTCWQLLLADERIRVARTLTRQSRTLIALARQRLARPAEPDAR